MSYRVQGKKSPVREYFGRGKTGEQTAKIRAAELNLSKTKGETLGRTSTDIYLDELAQVYLDDAKRRGVSEYWRKEFTALLNTTILPALSSRPVDQISFADIVRMADGWGKSVATTNRYLGYLRAVFRFGLDQDITTVNPLRKWRKAKETTKRDFRLTMEDFERIRAKAMPHLAIAMEIELMTWARPGPTELFKLHKRDIDPEAKTIRIRGTKTPTSDRLMHLDGDEVCRLLEITSLSKSGYLIEYAGAPVKQIARSWAAAVEAAGITYHVTPYDIRHLGISEALRAGADLAAVSQMAGHADISTTQRKYYHCLKGEKARAATLKAKAARPKAGKVVNFPR
ncbi:integrase [Desulfobaculum xiamenense]|uniref:Integrase n=1 Tax=Desulfobaculum xiamenense TaxID=995050 RepID=A0A846QGX9_9BACT|nr:integrase [Desulfobaculum xiamenense]